MEIAKIQVTRADARKIYCDTLTSGMVGAEITFSFDSSWDGLHKTAVFKAGQVVKNVLMRSDVVTIPHEVMAKRVPVIHVGVYGTNSDDTLVIPTVWVTIDGIRHGTDPSGDPSTDPTLEIWAQILDMIGDLKDLDTTAKDNLVAAVNEVLTKGGGSADPAEIRRIIEEYLKANTPTASDIGALPAPASAQVGQYFRVSAVDESGKVTAVEAVAAPSGGGSTEMTLLAEVDCSAVNGNIELTGLDNLTEIFVKWDGVRNASATASGYNLYINGTEMQRMFVPIAKQESTLYGYSTARYNGCAWLTQTSSGAMDQTNVAPSYMNAALSYNAKVGVGKATGIVLSAPVAAYLAAAGTVRIWGR